MPPSCPLEVRRRSRQLVTSPFVLPALHQIPSDFLSNLFRIVQRHPRVLPSLDLAALHVLPDFFLPFFGLVHYWHKAGKDSRIHQGERKTLPLQVRSSDHVVFDATQRPPH